MSQNNDAYLAGLIDGEGTITIGLEKRDKKNAYRPIIAITSTSGDFIKGVQNSIPFKTHLYSYDKTKYNPNWSREYKLYISTKEMLPFIDSIEKYVLLKATQLKLLKEFILTRDSNIYYILRKLNQRGGAGVT